MCIEQSEILSSKFTMRCSVYAIVEAMKLVVVAVATFASHVGEDEGTTPFYLIAKYLTVIFAVMEFPSFH